MCQELVVFVPAMQWIGDDPIYGPERRFVQMMLYWAVLDARAIAKRDAEHFKELNYNRKVRNSQQGNMWVIEQANRNLRKWLECDQFVWYCELLHWNIERVRVTIISIIEGTTYEELRDHLRLMGAIARWEKSNGIGTRLSQTTLCPMRSAGNDSTGVQASVWRHRTASTPCKKQASGA